MRAFVYSFVAVLLATAFAIVVTEYVAIVQMLNEISAALS